MMSHSVYFVLSILVVFVSAIIGGLTSIKLKIPVVAGYIVSGMLIGFLFPFVKDEKTLKMIAETGVTLLLFTIGLESSLFRIRKTINLIFWSVLVQVFAVFIIIYTIGVTLLKIPYFPSMFIALAAAFSSTAIAVRTLSEKMESETQYGEISTTWLVLQDFIIIPVMIIFSALKISANGNNQSVVEIMIILFFSIIRSVILIAGILIFGKIIIPKILEYISKFKNREIFLLTVVGIVVASSALTYILGLPAPIGAFLAGILISKTTQNHAIFAEIRPLRDLFTVVFFTSLGLMLKLDIVYKNITLVLILIPIIIIIKSIIINLLCRLQMLHRKTSFYITMLLVPISEFSFILGNIGLNKGLISEEYYVVISMVTFSAILLGSIFISAKYSLFLLINNKLLKLFPKFFKESLHLENENNKNGYPIKNHIILCGYGRVGKYIGRSLDMANIPYIVVDYNLNTINALKNKGIPVVYGDPSDKDILDYAQVDLGRSVIIAIPDIHAQEMIIAHSLSLNKNIKIISRVHREEDVPYLKSLGVSVVIQPEFEASLSIVKKIYKDFNINEESYHGKISRLKIEHGLI
jgi:monovalent cation:H+ antiporter-2, CPA2 family